MTRHPRAGMRDRWVAYVVRAKITGETRALLLYLALTMGDHGQVTVGTWADLALMFDVPKRRIAERFQWAREAGLLSKVSGGWHGAPAVWAAVIPTGDQSW